MATCPECDFDEIDATEYEEGDELSCPECGTNLVLSGPDELEVVDDDDDDDDDDEDVEEEGEEEEDADEDEVLDDEDEVGEEEE